MLVCFRQFQAEEYDLEASVGGAWWGFGCLRSWASSLDSLAVEELGRPEGHFSVLVTSRPPGMSVRTLGSAL